MNGNFQKRNAWSLTPANGIMIRPMNLNHRIAERLFKKFNSTIERFDCTNRIFNTVFGIVMVLNNLVFQNGLE